MLLQSDTSFPGTVCQALRILSFTVTQLPGPNYHCHLGEATAVREWPEHWWEHVTLDLGRQVMHFAGMQGRARGGGLMNKLSECGH